ncbi:hypothetical protein QYF36_012027 [Acer negundo]|nr:hypothetical protein QYF36_012027 [Acer negundo]
MLVKGYQTQKAKSEFPAVKEGKKAPLLTVYPFPMYMHPLLTDIPPYTVPPVLYDHRTFPVLAFMAYIGPFPRVEPAKRTPSANVTGPKASALLGSAIDHRSPFRASIATHPTEVVVLPPTVQLVFGFNI